MAEAFELLIKEKERKEKYHEEKERMAWLAGTLYYGFCLLIINYAIGLKGRLSTLHGVVLLLLSFVIFTAALRFVWLQFTMRWIANDDTVALNEVLRGYSDKLSVSACLDNLEQCKKQTKRPRKNAAMFIHAALWPILFWKDYRAKSEYRSELPAYAVALCLFTTKCLVIIFNMLDCVGK